MDKIKQDIRLQTESDFSSLVSPKRPRTDCAPMSPTGTSRFDSLEPCFKTSGSPSVTGTMQMSVVLRCAAECGDTENEKPNEQQHGELILNPLTKLTPSETDAADGACFMADMGCFILLVKDEQPAVPETDEFSSYQVDDAGGALEAACTSKDGNAARDKSSHPDCKRLGESHEDEAPAGCILPSGDDEDGRQVQNSVSHIQAFTYGSSDVEVRSWADCACEEMLNDTGFSNSQTHKDSNQRRDEHGSSENIFLSIGKEDGNVSTSVCNFENGISADGGESTEKPSELQVFENENVAVCDVERRGHVNENDPRHNFTQSATDFAQGSIASCDVVLARNIASENGSQGADDFCGARGKRAAGEMMAEAQSEKPDHTTETTMLARISQELAEGDNDVGLVSVIDSAIWRETDREAEEKRGNSDGTAGAELSSSVKVCTMEMPHALHFDVPPSLEISVPDQTREINQQSRTQQRKDENEDVCQSYTEPQACSIATNEAHNETDTDGSCHWKRSPSTSPRPPPAGDGRQESSNTMGHHLKGQDQSGCFPVSLDDLKTQEVEYLLTEIGSIDVATKIKGDGSFKEEVKHEEKSEDKLLWLNEKHEEIVTKITSQGWTEGKVSNYDRYIRDDNLECLCDHPYSNVTLITLTKGRQEETNVEQEDNSEVLVTSEDGHQDQGHLKGDIAEASPDDCICDWAECSGSESGNRLTPVCHLELNGCTSYQNKAETFTAENKDDLVTSAFPATSDAVVPSPHELIRSQNADASPAALNCSDRFSSTPSAFTFRDRVPEGFDTFEKIQLSLDDDDDDVVGVSQSPLLTSLPGQMLKTPQRQVYDSVPELESNEQEVASEEEGEGEEDVERLECHTENMANGFLSSDYSCNELPNFLSAADVTAPEWPEQQRSSDSAAKPSSGSLEDPNPQSTSPHLSPKSDSQASDVRSFPEFEMKKQFDLVLKELKLYFEISMSDFESNNEALPPPLADPLKEETLHLKQLRSPARERNGDAPSDEADEGCEGDPVVSRTSDCEQEVPRGSYLCQGPSEEHREPRTIEQRKRSWSPSFMCQQQLSYRPPQQTRRLEPLRTCTRPIRVGLSKRARTKHLHRPHPYK